MANLNPLIFYGNVQSKDVETIEDSNFHSDFHDITAITNLLPNLNAACSHQFET